MLYLTARVKGDQVATRKRKRPDGTGTVTKRGNRYYPYLTIDGERTNPTGQGFDTEEAAYQAMSKFTARETLHPRNSSALTFRELAESWLATHSGKPATIGEYRRQLNQVILPYWGDTIVTTDRADRCR